MFNAELTTKANAKNPVAFQNVMFRVNRMMNNRQAKDAVRAQGDLWLRMIISGTYTIVR